MLRCNRRRLVVRAPTATKSLLTFWKSLHQHHYHSTNFYFTPKLEGETGMWESNPGSHTYFVQVPTIRRRHPFRYGLTPCRIMQGVQQPNGSMIRGLPGTVRFGSITLAAQRRQHFSHSRLINPEAPHTIIACVYAPCGEWEQRELNPHHELWRLAAYRWRCSQILPTRFELVFAGSKPAVIDRTTLWE